ncbi:DUF2335 domain-containing protein [Streptococcus pluranimalium]|uniref:DUF2335 domain-containing protein n=1 Tax=Streptococcus pluranimalium TaxID=82348 RepID=UPI003F667621
MTNSNKKHKKNALSETQVIDLIESQPSEVQEEIAEKLLARRVQSINYSGPIPHPELLKQFNDVIDDGANRIMTMAENQATHRQKLELKMVNANNRDSLLGVIFGGLIGLSSVGGGIFLIYNNKNIQGLTVMISSLVALVAVYFRGQKKDEQELSDKD